MPLNVLGSNPIINIQFDAKIPASDIAESGACTIFLQDKNDIQWIEIGSFVNRPFSSHNLVLDPSIFLGPGASLKDLINTKIRYQTIFTDIDGDNKISCSFDFKLIQDGNILITDSQKKKSAATDNDEFFFFSNVFLIT